jgi:hypothetical protein
MVERQISRRWHKSQHLLTLATAAVIGIYMIGWLAGPTLLIVESDSGEYLRPALTWLVGRDYELGARTIGYPWLLGWVIRFGGLDAIAPVQMVLTMATAALTVATFSLAFRKKCADSITTRSAALCALCLFVLIAFLAFEPITTYSHSVMSETLSSFGTSLGVFCLIAALRLRDDLVRLSAAFVLGTVGSAGAFYTRPPALGVTLGVWLGLFAVLCASRAISSRYKLIISALVIGFVTVVMVIPENRLQQRYGTGSLVMAETLFCNHANIVLDVVSRVVSDVELSNKLEGILDDTLKHGPEGWPLLGFKGDRCVYLEDLQPVLNAHFGTAVDVQSKVLMSLFLEGVLSHPYSYSTKVGRQMLAALAKPFPRDRYVGTRRYYDEYRGWPEFANLHLFASNVEGESPAPLKLVAPPLFKMGREILNLLNKASLVLVATVIALFTCDIWRLWTSALALRKFASTWTTFGVFAFMYWVSLLIVALSHTFDDFRYRAGLAPLGLLFFLGCVMTSFDWLRIELARLRFRSKKPIATLGDIASIK